ncbi:hypothetical protein [Rhodospirillum sp. A1_3_36]|uniref:hypothetical protein n=1 Tax=Rhodospirillum sp. A1_3_36 TaxID=3391666 RepID=UPI0039A61521
MALSDEQQSPDREPQEDTEALRDEVVAIATLTAQRAELEAALAMLEWQQQDGVGLADIAATLRARISALDAQMETVRLASGPEVSRVAASLPSVAMTCQAVIGNARECYRMAYLVASPEFLRVSAPLSSCGTS